MAGHPQARRTVKIMTRANEWVPCFVADDEYRFPLPRRPFQELDGARVRGGFVHAVSVDVALHLGPHVFPPSLAQVFPHGEFRLPKTVGYDSFLDGNPVE